MAYTVLKVCGAFYLSWLGLQLLIRPRSSFSDGDDDKGSQGNWFIRGMLGNVLNPKMGIFYVSFLPQFIPAGHSPLIWTFILVSIHVAIGTIWSVTLILSTHFASAILKKNRVVQMMDRATGGLFLCFAAKMNTDTVKSDFCNHLFHIGLKGFVQVSELGKTLAVTPAKFVMIFRILPMAVNLSRVATGGNEH